MFIEISHRSFTYKGSLLTGYQQHFAHHQCKYPIILTVFINKNDLQKKWICTPA